MRKPLELVVIVFNDFGASICTRIALNSIKGNGEVMREWSHLPSSPGINLSPNFVSILSA